MQLFHFLGWRDAQALRPATFQPDWTEAQCKAYEAGYEG